MTIEVTTRSHPSSEATVGLAFHYAAPYQVSGWHEHSHLARQAVRAAFPGRDVASQSCKQANSFTYVHDVVLK